MPTHHVAAGIPRRTSARLRALLALGALAEVVVVVVVARQIGWGPTLLLAVATSVLGSMLLARQGPRALADLRDRSRTRQAPGRALGDAGLVALGGVLMVLPGFLGDVLGLLCLLPFTRWLPRALFARTVARQSTRSGSSNQTPRDGAAPPRVIEGEIVA